MQKKWLKHAVTGGAGALVAALLLVGVMLALGLRPLGLTSHEAVVVALSQDQGARGIVALGPMLPRPVLKGRELPMRCNKVLDEKWLRRTLQELGANGPEANRFVFFAHDQQASEIILILEGQSCGAPQKISASWPRRLLFALGLSRQQNNRPLLLYRCSGSDLARVYIKQLGPPFRPNS